MEARLRSESAQREGFWASSQSRELRYRRGSRLPRIADRLVRPPTVGHSLYAARR